MEPLHIRFEQTPEISYDFTNHYWKSRKLIRWGMWGMVGVAVLMIIQLLLSDESERGPLLSWVLPLVMVLLFWRFLIPFTMKRQIDRAAASNNLGTSREMIFSEEDFIVKTPQSDATFAYEAIVQVGQSELCYFLYIAHNQAMTLPKSALTVEEEQQLLALFTAHEIPLV